jgi:hypothetical protein
MKANADMNAIGQSQYNFYNTLQSQYGQQFANQSAILGSLNNAMAPILAGGINQQGFSAPEQAAMRTQAATGAGQAYTQASQATNEALAAKGGGNEYLPSGAAAEVNAGLASNAANANANAQNQITQANYATGRQNFLSAAGQEQQTASQYNPTGYASAAGQAGQQAFSTQNTLNQQNNAWKGQLAGILAGVGGAFIGDPGLGNQVTQAVNGPSGSNSSVPGYGGSGGGASDILGGGGGDDEFAGGF